MSPSAAERRLAELERWAVERLGDRAQASSYGPSEQQRAELLLPAGPGPHPVVVLLHGGFWRAPYTFALMRGLAVDLAERGWASWNVEYRRVGNGGGVPATLEDVEAAVRELRAAVQAPLRRDRIVVLGHSAGGQLALWAARLPGVALAVSLAGVCDLVTGYREGIGEGAVEEFLGGGPSAVPERYALADPMTGPSGPARVLLVHGDADDRVPVAQSRAHAAARRSELIELPGVDHFALIDPRTEAWQTIAAAVAARTQE